MPNKSVFWRPNEASLGRASLNSILEGTKKLDVTEEMMKSATIGRSAELGDTWEPPGMVSRKTAALLTEGGRRADDDTKGTQKRIQDAMQKLAAVEDVSSDSHPAMASSSSQPSLGFAPSGTEWNAMFQSRPRSRHEQLQMQRRPQELLGSSEALSAAGAMASGQPLHAPSGAEGAVATTFWGPKEATLSRDSYNAMCRHAKFDSTEVMMRNAMMSKAAMMGPGWDPPGITSRKIADVLTKQKS
eukprot:CAMPEP_0197637682 /NCGR_PEP_ID=MMETSP1338-20131121/12830_1 /TAXON_ID=43686 ORGANISM="Pelagodinium beii, Strain RCC1491" /NCGR_SAMPLE_ID=MMETSP1338 /ASSEMBLY_ACC=CAM_ASM_000754 /LENGTH=243 /DNA_ID=CAMNT_0043210133 /DNA_START=63 /DNA_END=794 /DNA_ORIENTATION=-